jgi:hypothetical protein
MVVHDGVLSATSELHTVDPPWPRRLHFFRADELNRPEWADRGNEPMRAYFFDMKDGVPVRDKSGLEFVSEGAAIAHSKSSRTRCAEKPKAIRSFALSFSTRAAGKFTASKSIQMGRSTEWLNALRQLREITR